MADVGPLNRVGDTVGSGLDSDGNVVTPPGFREAYRRYVDAGWGAVPFPPEFGGGGFPWLVTVVMQEMVARPTWRSRCARCSPRAPSTC